MSLTTTQKDAIAMELLGTASSLENLQREYGLDSLALEQVAEEQGVVLCQTCGWWVELSECNDDQICEECQGI